jgi:hypothetical protein
MSNQKTTQLRQLLSTGVEPGDWLPIVDVSEITAPTGETKKITAVELATYIVSGGFVDLAIPYRGWQSANGLAFDEGVSGTSDNLRCFGNIAALGNQFSVFVNGYVASDRLAIGTNRVLFGVGANTTPSEAGYTPHSAVIGIADNDLYAYVEDGVGTYAYIAATNFFLTYTERAFVAGLTKDLSGMVTLFINGVSYASSSGTGLLNSISNSKVVMGNGCLSENNVKCTIYDAHIFNTAITADLARNMFYRGVDTTDSTLVASYNSNTLNGGPTQWLDCVGSNHLLLPTTGAKATSPGKRFILSFPVSGTSQYLGDGSVRDVLPSKYVITSCLVESAGKPLLSVGSTDAVAPVSASGTGSWNNNRVALVSASYGVNPIGLLALGAAHADRSIYVFFSASAAPCTFSFDGYIRN